MQIFAKRKKFNNDGGSEDFCSDPDPTLLFDSGRGLKFSLVSQACFGSRKKIPKQTGTQKF